MHGVHPHPARLRKRWVLNSIENPSSRPLRLAGRFAGMRRPTAVSRMSEDLSGAIAAVRGKIASVLAAKPQCFITHPSELHVLKAMTPEELHTFATEQGWRCVRRVGGRQIEFYNDATVRADLADRI